jgi:hypothetical protein
MPKATVRLACRQIIDHHSPTPFEKNLFDVSFAEFCIQQQSFSKGQPYYTWASIRDNIPKSQQLLPFKVSFALAGLINSLQNKIPGLTDALGNEDVPFAEHRFSLIASDARDPSAHSICLTWITCDLLLYEIIGDRLPLSQHPPQTFQLDIRANTLSDFHGLGQPGLSIISYEPFLSPCPARQD